MNMTPRRLCLKYWTNNSLLDFFFTMCNSSNISHFVRQFKQVSFCALSLTKINKLKKTLFLTVPDIFCLLLIGSFDEQLHNEPFVFLIKLAF